MFLALLQKFYFATKVYLAVLVTILVPGFSDDTEILRGLESHLRGVGIAAYAISPQPSNGVVSIEVLAQRLAATLEQQFAATTTLNFVGFSMGGLICRSYIQQYGGLARTERLITIATPHQGTWTAYSYNRPACVEMRPGSAFLATLNRDLSALEQLNFTSIWTPFDLTILPPTSSYLPVGEMVQIWSPFHYTLLLDPRIVQIITTQLQQPYDHYRKKVASQR